jgi:glycosyltransferase involved in cell wall biosynthesis
MSFTPLVSILTPTWNRAIYLERVWRGLQSQTYKKIEWIISDDGSDDDTVSCVAELARNSDFPILFIRASVHIGKARMDNEAIGVASGEFILWCDSDDYLIPKAVEKLVETWNSIPTTQLSEYTGVTALCANYPGDASTALHSTVDFDTTWNDLSERLKLTEDMLYFVRTSDLRAYPFPEVDFVIPEGVVWTSLGHKKVRVHSKVLKINEYKAPNCISFSGKMEYCRGRAYSMAVSEHRLKSYPRPMMTLFWKLITFIRYSLHGEIGIMDQMRLWGNNSLHKILLLLWPIALLLVLRDQLRGKVRYTHRDFIAASEMVSISYSRMGRQDQSLHK